MTDSIESIVFFGTPAFAVPTLEALHAAGRTPRAVVCQPARGAGRGRTVRQPPVAQWAGRHEVELLQPERVKRPEFVRTIEALEPDLAVVVAFGQIFPQVLLDVPRLGCVNVHASLLPAWRGASPIAAAIRAGDETTGVTTMQMEAGLDSGPILLQQATPILSDETCGELTVRLAALGAELLVRTVAGIERGTVTPAAQNDDEASFAPLQSRSDAWIDWSLTAAQIYDTIRAHDPWPGSRTTLTGRDLVIRRAAIVDVGEVELGDSPRSGEVVGVHEEAVLVGCGEGTILSLLEVQRPGRRAVRGADLWNGERLSGGECLGASA